MSHEPLELWHRWDHLRRDQVREIVAEGMVVVPLGAIEQHGPYLPTGTDILLSSEIVERALDRASARSPRSLVLASFLRIGCSAHHLPFGGTISLPPGVMIDVLVAALTSMVESGVSRVVLVNGHGGNTGVCNAAASQVASTTPLTVVCLDYWDLAPKSEVPVPGHAGMFETALSLDIHPHLVEEDRRPRDEDAVLQPGRGVHSAGMWSGIDGYTDEPWKADGSIGHQLRVDIVDSLADRLVAIAGELP